MKQRKPPPNVADITVVRRPRISVPSHHRRPTPVAIPRASLGPPSDFPLDDLAREEWKRVVPTLVLLGADLTLDRAAILCYVTAVSDLQKMREVWIAEGMPRTIDRPAGPRPHPLLGMVRDATRDVQTFAHALGLDGPRSRRALGVEVVLATDDNGSGSSRYFD